MRGLDCEIFLSSSGESERANGKGQSNRKLVYQGFPGGKRQGVRKDSGEGANNGIVRDEDASPVCAIENRRERAYERVGNFRQGSHIQ